MADAQHAEYSRSLLDICLCTLFVWAQQPFQLQAAAKIATLMVVAARLSYKLSALLWFYYRKGIVLAQPHCTADHYAPMGFGMH